MMRTIMIMFIFDGEILDNNKRALNALIKLEYIGLLDQFHYMKEVPRRSAKTKTSNIYKYPNIGNISKDWSSMEILVPTKTSNIAQK